jgi:hypothetical protein
MRCAVALNRLQEAKNAYEESRAHDADYLPHEPRYFVAFLENDKEEMDRQVAWSANSELADRFLSMEGDTNAFYGKIEITKEFNRRAVELAESHNEKPTAGGYSAAMAVKAAEVGYSNLATRLGDTALELGLSSFDQALTAVVLARAGNSAGAKKIIDRLAKQYPRDTWVNYFTQTASAAIELNNHNPGTALRLLEPTARY